VKIADNKGVNFGIAESQSPAGVTGADDGFCGEKKTLTSPKSSK
jgi:hypothetical protein